MLEAILSKRYICWRYAMYNTFETRTLTGISKYEYSDLIKKIKKLSNKFGYRSFPLSNYEVVILSNVPRSVDLPRILNVKEFPPMVGFKLDDIIINTDPSIKTEIKAIVYNKEGLNFYEEVELRGWIEPESIKDNKGISSLKWNNEPYMGFDQIKKEVLIAIMIVHKKEPLPRFLEWYLKNTSPKSIDLVLHKGGAFLRLIEDSKRFKPISKTWKIESLDKLKIWGLKNKTLRKFWKDEHAE
jgi:hypothetical protein